MPTRRRLPLLLLTHAVALAAGLALVSRYGPPSPGQTTAASTPEKSTSPNKTAPRDPATTWSAAEILREVDDATAAKQAASGDAYLSTAVRTLREELARNGSDATTAFETLLNRAIRAESNPQRYVAPRFDEGRIRALLTIIGQDQGPLALAAYLGKATGLNTDLTDAIGPAFARDASLAHAAELKAAVPPDNWPQVAYNLSTTWPANRRDDLLQWALSENHPDFLVQSVEPGSPARWLADILARPDLPEDFRRELRRSAAAYITTAADLPVATRLGIDPSNSPRLLASLDVEQAFRGATDWAYRFQQGQSTPQEILSALAGATPQMAATNADQLRDALYLKLAEIDPLRAGSLLDGLPPEQRTTALLAASVSDRYQGAPDPFLTLIDQVPDTPETRDQRLLAWQQRTTAYVEISRETYALWLGRIPAGIDREMAFFTAAGQMRTYDPARAAELLSHVTDPQLLQQSQPRPR